MGATLFKSDILFLQRFLTCGGFDPKGMDGTWGPHTQRAVEKFEAASAAVRASLGSFDDRSEQHILGLHVPVQRAARRSLRALLDAGFSVKILSGTRTYAEQNELYALGRTKPGSIVTKARGGASNHNFGLAWDIGLWVEGYYDGKKKPVDRALERRAAARYVEASEVVGGLGTPRLEWGGSWTRFSDPPHYQIDVGLTLAELRQHLKSGTRYL